MHPHVPKYFSVWVCCHIPKYMGIRGYISTYRVLPLPDVALRVCPHTCSCMRTCGLYSVPWGFSIWSLTLHSRSLSICSLSAGVIHIPSGRRRPILACSVGGLVVSLVSCWLFSGEGLGVAWGLVGEVCNICRFRGWSRGGFW
jgi:hypothetical protein